MQNRFSNLQLFVICHGARILLVHDGFLTPFVKLLCHNGTELVVQFDKDVDCEGGSYQKLFHEGCTTNYGTVSTTSVADTNKKMRMRIPEKILMRIRCRLLNYGESSM